MTANDKKAMYTRLAAERGYRLDDFIQWHEWLGIPNFDWHELLVNCENEGNDFPPLELWENIIATAKLAQKLRDEIKTPISISSGYRAPEYNKTRGSKRSRHLYFNALDLQSVLEPKALFAKALELRRAGEFKGGVGLYSWGIHIDTRGKNATWGMR